ncbi:hypothetical protein [Ferroplasma acidarmanus]|nr:hypothetical protein [Ferroplasma acidarmanus]
MLSLVPAGLFADDIVLIKFAVVLAALIAVAAYPATGISDMPSSINEHTS